MFHTHLPLWLFVAAALLAGPHLITQSLRLMAAAFLFGVGFMSLLLWTYGGVAQ